ncbi:DUF4234 domain-containing protein [Sporosarcina oncorhynchi]|uniref:DUF4234 domain-containing protein n=1 Tax=Sporosarcina oncorhynchi TaxID=3056444 RepID=A0ABZ0L6Q9_9BACL|nr:DUF4234 domain-containing protein [Sporosarcina sp. T2O-4]WOV88254.1 DUF4234 domain-containing protein [Sporosarcina sp. T2O-4]
MNDLTFKKTNTALTVLLTNVTFGVYVPYWFISRRDSISQLGKEEVNYNWLKFLFVSYAFLAFYFIIGGAFLTEMGTDFVDTFNIIITFIGLGITYYSVFRVAEAIERMTEDKVFNRVLLILFHIWYLQYKINRME